MENERVEDVNERLRKAAESENGRDMVDRVCNPAIIPDQTTGRISTMTENQKEARRASCEEVQLPVDNDDDGGGIPAVISAARKEFGWTHRLWVGHLPLADILHAHIVVRYWSGQARRRLFYSCSFLTFYQNVSFLLAFLSSVCPFELPRSDPDTLLLTQDRDRNLFTMVQISEVKGNPRENRTAAHTHIRGLGLNLDGTPEPSGDGFIGQAAAREVRDILPMSSVLHAAKRSFS